MKKLVITILFIPIHCFLVNAQFTKLFDFKKAESGENPTGGLISDGTFLYGMAPLGGANNLGTLFKVKLDGTGFVKLIDFAGASNGGSPKGSPYFDGTYLYVTTSRGGVNDEGAIIKIKPDGTGFSKILDFDGSTKGSTPSGSLISDGTYLYGTASWGGTNDLGVIYKIKPDGSGFSKLLDISSSTGAHPTASLFYDGTFLFGVMNEGGANDSGSVYKIKPDGTGFQVLHSFSLLDGIFPACFLISDGTSLYGTTFVGGTNSYGGTTFKINKDGSGFKNLHSFLLGDNLHYPNGSLVYDGTYLYGSCNSGGGPSANGGLFRIKPDGTAFEEICLFESLQGSKMRGSLTIVNNNLYGMTQEGGVNYDGVIFKYDPSLTGLDLVNEKKEIQTYPNPAKDKLYILIKDPSSVEVLNIQGQTVISENITKEESQIEISNLYKGIYFLKLRNSAGTHLTKFVKE